MQFRALFAAFRVDIRTSKPPLNIFTSPELTAIRCISSRSQRASSESSGAIVNAEHRYARLINRPWLPPCVIANRDSAAAIQMLTSKLPLMDCASASSLAITAAGLEKPQNNR
jgi:hypothetical protein